VCVCDRGVERKAAVKISRLANSEVCYFLTFYLSSDYFLL